MEAVIVWRLNIQQLVQQQACNSSCWPKLALPQSTIFRLSVNRVGRSLPDRINSSNACGHFVKIQNLSLVVVCIP